MARRSGTKEWTGLNFGFVSLSATQAVVGSVVHDVMETVLRIRGNLLLVATANAAQDDDVAGLGFIVASDNAIAAGGASLPGPINDPDAPWLWHQYVPLGVVAVTAADDTAIGTFARVEIDSRAMRKATRNEGVVFMAELSTGEFASIQMTGGFRVLSLFG